MKVRHFAAVCLATSLVASQALAADRWQGVWGFAPTPPAAPPPASAPNPAPAPAPAPPGHAGDAASGDLWPFDRDRRHHAPTGPRLGGPGPRSACA
jgi:hypothetical protein